VSAVAPLAEENGAAASRLRDGRVARLEAIIKNITQLADGLTSTFPVLVHDAIDQAMRSLRRSWQHKNKLIASTSKWIVLLQSWQTSRAWDCLNQLLDQRSSLARIALRWARAIRLIHMVNPRLQHRHPEGQIRQNSTFIRLTARVPVLEELASGYNCPPDSGAPSGTYPCESEEGHGSIFAFELPIADVKS
jgi:hypothetical protein